MRFFTQPEWLLRLLTAIILALGAFAAVFYLPFVAFSWLSGGLMLLAAWEWSRLSGYFELAIRFLYVAVVALGVGCSYYMPISWLINLSSLMGCALVMYMIQQLIHGALPMHTSHFTASLGVIAFVLCWRALILLKQVPHALWLGLLVIWLSDTLAYVIGNIWGRHLLAPMISPRKTWEGLAAALLGPVLLVALMGNYAIVPAADRALLFVVFMTSIVAISGDLFESLTKRQKGFKDSSQLLPGHGGVLDRIDSLVVSIPIYAVGLYRLDRLV